MARSQAWLVQDEASQLGLSLEVSYPHPAASHWRFCRGKVVVGEYWPTTERFTYHLGRRRLLCKEVVPLGGLVERLTDLCPEARLDQECDARLALCYT